MGGSCAGGRSRRCPGAVSGGAVSGGAVSGGAAPVAVLKEAYRYEGAGRLLEATGPAREYGAGGVLLSRGEERFSQDGEGRRVEKVRRAEADVDSGGGSGVFAGGEATTRYEWNGRGMLRAVLLPDGARVSHVYDTQGRRASKRVARPDGSRTETRYTWAGEDMIHEITWSVRKGESPAPLRACAYVYDDGGLPLAHRETVWGEGGPRDGEWVHYALGPGDMPELLIGGDGAILARVRATVWGHVEVDSGARGADAAAGSRGNTRTRRRGSTTIGIGSTIRRWGCTSVRIRWGSRVGSRLTSTRRVGRCGSWIRQD